MEPSGTAVGPGGTAVEAAAAAAARRAAGPDRRWWVLAVLASVAFMAQLDLFIVNIALPAMTASFRGAGLGDLSWVLNAYAIVFAALLVRRRPPG